MATCLQEHCKFYIWVCDYTTSHLILSGIIWTDFSNITASAESLTARQVWRGTLDLLWAACCPGHIQRYQTTNCGNQREDFEHLLQAVKQEPVSVVSLIHFRQMPKLWLVFWYMALLSHTHLFKFSNSDYMLQCNSQLYNITRLLERGIRSDVVFAPSSSSLHIDPFQYTVSPLLLCVSINQLGWWEGMG